MGHNHLLCDTFQHFLSFMREKNVDYSAQACNERNYVFGTSIILPISFYINERKTLTHISYLFHIQREDHRERSALAHIHKSLIHCLSYNTRIQAQVQLLLPLFCTTSQHQILPMIFKQSLSKFQAPGKKELQHHRD